MEINLFVKCQRNCHGVNNFDAVLYRPMLWPFTALNPIKVSGTIPDVENGNTRKNAKNAAFYFVPFTNPYGPLTMFSLIPYVVSEVTAKTQQE